MKNNGFNMPNNFYLNYIFFSKHLSIRFSVLIPKVEVLKV